MTDVLLRIAFGFAVFGSKLALAVWIIYYLFPAEGRCPNCGAATLPLKMTVGQRLMGRVFFMGRVRQRLCPECWWGGFTRLPARPPARLVESPAPEPAGQRR